MKLLIFIVLKIVEIAAVVLGCMGIWYGLVKFDYWAAPWAYGCQATGNFDAFLAGLATLLIGIMVTVVIVPLAAICLWILIDANWNLAGKIERKLRK
jgi:hypothetical protein